MTMHHPASVGQGGEELLHIDDERPVHVLARAAGRLRRQIRTDLRLVTLDSLAIVGAYVVALLLRYDGEAPLSAWHRLPFAVALALVLSLVLHLRLGLYGRVWPEAGPAEAFQLVVATLTVTAVVTGLTALAPGHMPPLAVPVNAGALVLLLLGGLRFGTRLVTQRRMPFRSGTGVFLVGPPAAVRAVVNQMQQDASSDLVPVAVVTDDPALWDRRLADVPVVGPLEELPRLARTYRAEQVVLLPGALDGRAVGRLAELAREAGLRSRTLPTLRESMNRRPRLQDIRDLSLEDLLGRDQVEVTSPDVRAIVGGHRVLVTGAGGSIGSEIAAQVSQLGPASLILLDHDETHLHDALSRVSGPARCVLGDIRDRAFVERLFLDSRPEVVFHAAAHKHVPILEDHPCEAVRTNVAGTQVLVQAALRAGTNRFVAISTDKAVDPSSVMGATKRLSEQLVVAQQGPGRHYCAVRFGNVLGSRGSVVPTFLRQVAEGGPVTVTHPDMTRFFMTTREAVALVLQAAATSMGGEIFLLDMGEPVRIVDLAERVISLAGLVKGRDIEIKYVGLRPGEKLTEQLSGDHETVHPTGHPKVSRVASDMYDEDVLRAGVRELAARAANGDRDGTRALLFELARLPHELRPDGEVAAALRAWSGNDGAVVLELR